MKSFAEIRSFIFSLGSVLLLAFMFKASILELYVIPSGSMIPTLQIDDRIAVWKLSYGFRFLGVQKTLLAWSSPKRQDVVVFTREDDPLTKDDESDTNIIKRVVAIGGDNVELRGKELFVNGEKQNEDFVQYEFGGTTDFPAQKVPPGHVLLLGDNRDNSKDSRFWSSSPFLPVDNIKGQAITIVWPGDTWDRWFNLIK